MKISLVLGEVPGAKGERALGVKCRANYTTAIALLRHNFRMTNFVDIDERNSQTLVLLYNELEE
jgi:hypothetical protein